MPGLSRQGRYLELSVAILLPLLWLTAVRLGSLAEGGEVSVDSYYHVVMADNFPKACIARTFPWLTMSLWQDTFYDKELLFHAALAGVRGIGSALGVSADAPFHLPALVFGLGLIVVFSLLGQALRVPHVHLFSVALVAFSPVYTQRLLMLRPFLLSIFIMLSFCWHLVRVRSFWPSFVFGFVASYAYSLPHLILLPALAFGALRFAADRRLALLVPAATLAGLFGGLTLHPQFPNTYLLWKIQSVDVILQILGRNAPVLIGNEVYRPPPIWFALNAAFFACALGNVAGLLWLRRRLPLSRLSFETAFFLTLQAITAAGSLLSQRTLEYAWPLALLASGVVLRDCLAWGCCSGWSVPLRARLRLATSVASFVALVASGAYLVRWIAPNRARELRSFGSWASRLAPGTVIANVNWADFPVLLHSAPQCRYLMGFEPMFSYAVLPDEFVALENFRTGRRMLSPRELRALTRARFAFVGRTHVSLAGAMLTHRFPLAHSSVDGWVFDLSGAEPGKASGS